MKIDKKTRILKLLNKGNYLSKSKIASLIRANLWITELYLEDLAKEDKIEKMITPNAVYWRLKRKEICKEK